MVSNEELAKLFRCNQADVEEGQRQYMRLIDWCRDEFVRNGRCHITDVAKGISALQLPSLIRSFVALKVGGMLETPAFAEYVNASLAFEMGKHE